MSRVSRTVHRYSLSRRIGICIALVTADQNAPRLTGPAFRVVLFGNCCVFCLTSVKIGNLSCAAFSFVLRVLIGVVTCGLRSDLRSTLVIPSQK